MIEWGSLVCLVTPRGRRVIKRLVEGQDWQSTDGILKAEDLAKSDFGQEIRTHLGVPVLVQEATLFDRLQNIKRQTQIIYSKDIAYICLKLGAGPNRKILEAGCGSGGLTLALSWFCGPTGKVVTHDMREEFLHLCKKNLEWAGVGGNVDYVLRDIAEGFAENEADAIFLDTRCPWLYLDHALVSLKRGGTMGFILPTSAQVQELLLALETRPFTNIEVTEIFVRGWKPLADRLRPQDRMVAHTGFLIFCRAQEMSEEFRNYKPKGTRERKQEAARSARLTQHSLKEDARCQESQKGGIMTFFQNLKNKFFGDPNEEILIVSGMKCPNCQKKVEEIARATEGIAHARVDLARQELRYTKNANVDLEDLKKRIREAGFDPR